MAMRGKRTVDVGEDRELKFKFKATPLTLPSTSITVDFDQGCSVSINY